MWLRTRLSEEQEPTLRKAADQLRVKLIGEIEHWASAKRHRTAQWYMDDQLQAWMFLCSHLRKNNTTPTKLPPSMGPGAKLKGIAGTAEQAGMSLPMIEVANGSDCARTPQSSARTAPSQPRTSRSLFFSMQKRLSCALLAKKRLIASIAAPGSAIDERLVQDSGWVHRKDKDLGA